ncbi:MAG TPA: hypothetical protein VFL04_00815 [Rectinemataceae bacterium]|nr:hypothetical protein [Rectinemataceae bacterium]
MTRAEFAAELGGIIRLLREHSFLAYSASGRREYEQKLRTCGDYFAYLVFRKTGIPVRSLPGLVPIESAREANYATGRRLVKRAAANARATAEKCSGLDRDYYLGLALLWERAAERLEEPEPRNRAGRNRS